ncbi:MAG: flagellar basal-body rod protein FlgF [Thermodesulfovibrionales bacterium]|nr:flagellar basal-body rod protein FlgF [Thermodesulfovibrionales bacterium]
MNKAIYIALSGAVLRELHMDIITQNLANADTIGYKKGKISFNDYLLPQDFLAERIDFKALSYHSPLMIDFSEGNLYKTGNPLDIAIDGNGFIALEGSRYTRRGDLRKDKENFLVTHNGIKVLGEKGAIKLPDGKVEINSSGRIIVNGVEIDTIKVVHFDKLNELKKVDDSLFHSQQQGKKSLAMIKQGFLETSNVNVISEMVKMIVTLREYEAYQKAIHTFDEATAKVNNEIGRL